MRNVTWKRKKSWNYYISRKKSEVSRKKLIKLQLFICEMNKKRRSGNDFWSKKKSSNTAPTKTRKPWVRNTDGEQGEREGIRERGRKRGTGRNQTIIRQLQRKGGGEERGKKQKNKKTHIEINFIWKRPSVLTLFFMTKFFFVLNKEKTAFFSNKTKWKKWKGEKGDRTEYID